MLKTHIGQLARPETTADRDVLKTLIQRTQRLEAHLHKVEVTLTRSKPGPRIPTRPTASTPPSIRAKRALSVLLTGLNSSNCAKRLGNMAGHDSPDITDDERDRIVRRKTEAIVGKPILLSSTGKVKATPIRDDSIAATLKRAARGTDLSLVQIHSSNGVLFECRNVFRAYMWFKQVDPPTEKRTPAELRHSYNVPEHIAFFGIDERNISRWSRSQYGVFNVVSERANAAIRFYMNRETTGEDAFVALVKWLSRHKSLFTAKCERRRVAFDASRGMFLPPCVYPFEEDASPRFTRGSIPLRHISSNPAPPTVRLPAGSAAQQQAQVQAAHANAPNSGPQQSRGGTAAAHAAAAAAQQARRQGQSIAKQQPVPVTMGATRAPSVDTRAAQNRQR
ncbi:unnamed protein product [Chondrus crispus]|uniref:Uncharacterized protein n=1 Tax=Chondrus crispus TaxID=2769 RepID=R7QC80_CHOCR|nr:unnamed protein product [Chondrus crispus]CDF35065.1 unnamed protein product [Chondrus crispus]|eukprot:XP_005714884.1 unnamed protein product [Chondrus crispus]